MIAITGAKGFIGTHLTNYLKYILNEEVIVLDRKSLELNPKELSEILKQCNVIIHLAGVNRSDDEDYIYNENVKLADILLKALMLRNLKPKFINLSSIHENGQTNFGKAKKKVRELIEQYYHDSPNKHISLICPNVFGPFCKPYYNSFVATFCDQLINGKTPILNDDREIELLYVDDLILTIIQILHSNTIQGTFNKFKTTKIKISDVLTKLELFDSTYRCDLEIPNLKEELDLRLFNTFRSYLGYNFFPKKLIRHKDDRGDFVEVLKLQSGGQISFSTTKPKVIRGNHFHTRKIERFQILSGKALVQLRKINTNEIIEYVLDGNELEFIDIPIWHTHNLINISEEEELLMLFWINEKFSPEFPDTYYLDVKT